MCLGAGGLGKFMYVECERLRLSVYWLRETANAMELFKPMEDLVHRRRLNMHIDVNCKVDLSSVPRRSLVNRATSAIACPILVSCGLPWRDEYAERLIKTASLNEVKAVIRESSLIVGSKMAWLFRRRRVSEETDFLALSAEARPGDPRFIDSVAIGYVVTWQCSSDASINALARHPAETPLSNASLAYVPLRKVDANELASSRGAFNIRAIQEIPINLKIVFIVTFYAAFGALESAEAERLEIPSRFTANQVYVRLQTLDGKPLELYTDSGGGSLILGKVAAERLQLALVPIQEADVLAELGASARETEAPLLRPEVPRLPTRAFVIDSPRQMPAFPEQADGVVGAAWFADGIWTWDYPMRHLYKENPGWRAALDARKTDLGFQIDSHGKRTTNFARISISVAGEQLQMLLDTGAETYLSPEAKAYVQDRDPAFRASSMMRASIFDAWRKSHPEWRFVDNAEVSTGAPMILVPEVRVAGLRARSVWFTRRPDKNYTDFMSSMMDQAVDGSVGGNCFSQFVLTVDYPRATAALTERRQ